MPFCVLTTMVSGPKQRRQLRRERREAVRLDAEHDRRRPCRSPCRSPVDLGLHLEVAVGADDAQAALLHRLQVRHRARTAPRLRRPSRDARRYSRRSRRRRRWRFSRALCAYTLATRAALNLAGRRARNRVGDVNLLRTLEVGELLAAVLQQLVLGNRLLGRTTAAATSSPHVACGTPNATASATAGCASSASSISRGEIFSPPRLISSLMRADQVQIAVRVEVAAGRRCGTSRR